MCVGQSATLTASGASTYTWNPGGTGSSIVVTPTINTTYTIVGTSSLSCNNTTLFTQAVSACMGINQVSNVVSEINIYPNPFNNRIIIETNSEKQLLQIFSNLGTLIYNQEIENVRTEIDLNIISTGIYFIKVGTEIKKVIKE